MRFPFYDTNRLDTPIKRVGYILLLLGLGIAITSILIFSVLKFRPGYWGNYFYGIFIGWPTEFIDEFMYQVVYRKVFFLGVCLSVIGFMISFAYDSTLGRLLHWIKTGNKGRGMDDAKAALEKKYAGDPTALIKFNKTVNNLLEQKQDERQSRSLNKDGEIAGSVIHHSDGRNTIVAKDNFDFTALMTSTFIVFSDHITQDEKNSFSEWAGLSSDEWTSLHREKFAHAMMHHFYDLKESGAIVPDAIKGVIQQLSQNTLPPLIRSLTNEVRKIFNGQFLEQ